MTTETIDTAKLMETLDNYIEFAEKTRRFADVGFYNGVKKCIDALTARVEGLEAERDEIASAVRWAPSSAHWSEELRRLLGKDARTGIDALEQQLREAEARAAPVTGDQRDHDLCPRCEGSGRVYVEAIENWCACGNCSSTGVIHATPPHKDAGGGIK